MLIDVSQDGVRIDPFVFGTHLVLAAGDEVDGNAYLSLMRGANLPSVREVQADNVLDPARDFHIHRWDLLGTTFGIEPGVHRDGVYQLALSSVVRIYNPRMVPADVRATDHGSYPILTEFNFLYAARRWHLDIRMGFGRGGAFSTGPLRNAVPIQVNLRNWESRQDRDPLYLSNYDLNGQLNMELATEGFSMVVMDSLPLFADQDSPAIRTQKKVPAKPPKVLSRFDRPDILETE